MIGRAVEPLSREQASSDPPAGRLDADVAQQLLNRISTAALVLARLADGRGGSDLARSLMEDLDVIVREIQGSVFGAPNSPADPVDRADAALRQVGRRLNEEWANRLASGSAQLAASRIAEAARLLRAAAVELHNAQAAPPARRPTLVGVPTCGRNDASSATPTQHRRRHGEREPA